MGPAVMGALLGLPPRAPRRAAPRRARLRDDSRVQALRQVALRLMHELPCGRWSKKSQQIGPRNSPGPAPCAAARIAAAGSGAPMSSTMVDVPSLQRVGVRVRAKLQEKKTPRQPRPWRSRQRGRARHARGAPGDVVLCHCRARNHNGCGVLDLHLAQQHVPVLRASGRLSKMKCERSSPGGAGGRCEEQLAPS